MMRSVRWTLAGLFVQLLLLAGCGSGREPSQPIHDQIVQPSPSKEARPSARPSRALTGRLGFDDVEGGCAYLELDDGSRYEVIYPEGWHVDRSTASLLGPGGERVAAGSIVTVRGSIASDRSSICQLGPIFEATKVQAGG